MNFRAVFLALAGAALLASCGEPGAVYQIPAKQMRQQLIGAKPPAILFGSHTTSTRAHQRGDGSIVWTVSEDNKALFRFIGTTEAVNDQSTKIVLSIAGPTDDANDPMAKKFDDHPQIAKLYLRAMEEAIDSKLTGRTFDISKFRGEMMAAAMAEMPEIQAQFDEAVATGQSMEQAMREAERAQADREWEQSIAEQVVE